MGEDFQIDFSKLDLEMHKKLMSGPEIRRDHMRQRLDLINQTLEPNLIE